MSLGGSMVQGKVSTMCYLTQPSDVGIMIVILPKRKWVPREGKCICRVTQLRLGHLQLLPSGTAAAAQSRAQNNSHLQPGPMVLFCRLSILDPLRRARLSPGRLWASQGQDRVVG